jgi:type IV pilus assembly protein PilA
MDERRRLLQMKTQKGFTLIELAVVIAIIAILAAVAIPRFADTTAQAELSMIKDFKATLASSAAIYTAAQATTPTDFSAYVAQTAPPLTGNFTISTYGFGPKGTATPCTVSAATITCAGTFNKYTSVTYTYNSGNITGSATPTTGSAITF